LKKKVVTAAALGMVLLFCAQGARAANLASDNGSLYQNPWGPGYPNQTGTGFAPWVFDQWNPSTSSPWTQQHRWACHLVYEKWCFNEHR